MILFKNCRVYKRGAAFAFSAGTKLTDKSFIKVKKALDKTNALKCMGPVNKNALPWQEGVRLWGKKYCLGPKHTSNTVPKGFFVEDRLFEYKLDVDGFKKLGDNLLKAEQRFNIKTRLYKPWENKNDAEKYYYIARQYTPSGKNDIFKGLYAVKKYFKRSISIIAEKDNTPVGTLLFVKDLGDTRAMAMVADKTPGVALCLIGRAYTELKKHGVNTVFSGYISENNNFSTNIVKAYGGEAIGESVFLSVTSK